LLDVTPSPYSVLQIVVLFYYFYFFFTGGSKVTKIYYYFSAAGSQHLQQNISLFDMGYGTLHSLLSSHNSTGV